MITLRQQRNSRRLIRAYRNRPFTERLKMHDNEKWAQTPLGNAVMKRAIFALILQESGRTRP